MRYIEPFEITVALDLGHWGKPHKPDDRGAITNDNTEAWECARLVVNTAVWLEKFGIRVFMLTFGKYKDRQKFANWINADYYFSFHLNYSKPPGKYGLILYDELKEGDNERARILAEEFEKKLGYTFNFWSVQKNKRGSICIRYAKMPAFILEFGFINNNYHLRMIKPFDIAKILFDSIARFPEFQIKFKDKVKIFARNLKTRTHDEI